MAKVEAERIGQPYAMARCRLLKNNGSSKYHHHTKEILAAGLVRALEEIAELPDQLVYVEYWRVTENGKKKIRIEYSVVPKS